MKTSLFIAFAAAFPLALAAQNPPQACTHRGTAEAVARRPSPLDSVQIAVDGATIKVCYGRPSLRGRTILGAQDPYGRPWRLGANEPTRIFVPFAAEIAGVRVAPGVYSLYVVPQEKSWEVHVNRAVDRWGIPIDSAVQAQDVGKGTVPVEALDQSVEQLTLSLVAGNPVELVYEWATARVRIPIRKVG